MQSNPYESPTSGGEPVDASQPAVPLRSWVQNAAKASWCAPLISIGMGVMVQPSLQGNRAGALIISLLQLGLFGLGLVCGFAALIGAKSTERRKIIVPSVIGIFINLAIIAFAVSAVMMLQRIRETQRAKQMSMRSTEATATEKTAGSFSFSR